MSAFVPSSSIGLPNSLNYSLPPSLSDSSRCYTVSVQPDATNSVSASGLTLTGAAANTFTKNAFNSQNITFTIPSGSSRSVFMDCRETVLSFRLGIQVTTQGAGGAGITHNLIGSAQSFFDSLILYSNNIPLEQINSYNLLANMLLNSTTNTAEKYGGCAVSLGCDINSQTGVDLPTVSPVNAAGTGVYYNFAIPLISLIGLNSQDQMFPIGAVGNLMLTLQTASTLPFSFACTTQMATAEVATVTLDNFSLNLRYVDIGPESASLLYSTHPDGKLYIKARTWQQASSNIPNGTGGLVNLPYQIRNSSVKSLLIQNSTDFSAVCPNGYYDALNLACTQFSVTTSGGLQFPQSPFNPSLRPGQCFVGFMSALGYSGNYKAYGGCMTRDNYGASMAGTTVANIPQLDSMMVIPAAAVRARSGIDATNVSIQQFPNMHYLGVDFEKSSGILFNGISTRSSPPQANFYLNAQTPVAFTSFCFALVDAVVVVDVMAQTVQVFI